MGAAFGTHHRLNGSGLVQASNTTRAGPPMSRVTTYSQSDLRSAVVVAGSFSLVAPIDRLLPFQRGPEAGVLMAPNVSLMPAGTMSNFAARSETEAWRRTRGAYNAKSPGDLSTGLLPSVRFPGTFSL